MNPVARVAIYLLISFFGLVACQSTPPASSGLSPAQVKILKQEGFVQSDEGWEFSASEKLLFGSNEATLVPNARQTVERIARLMIEMGILSIRIDGHADASGNQAYNDQLSLRRAQAVADVMTAAGMPANGIQVRGLGSRVPVQGNQTAEGRAQNRRVVLLIGGA